jgi:hypothetical protein
MRMTLLLLPHDFVGTFIAANDFDRRRRGDEGDGRD